MPIACKHTTTSAWRMEVSPMFPSMHPAYGIRTGLVQMKDVSCNAPRSLQSFSLYLLLLTRSFVHISGLNNNQAPAYMTSNPTTWMFNDQNSCCKQYYPWSLAMCMSIASVSPTTSAVSALIGSFFRKRLSFVLLRYVFIMVMVIYLTTYLYNCSWVGN